MTGTDHSAPYLDGWFAHKAGAVVMDNPHSGTNAPYSHIQWSSGWCQRFSACKHGLDMSLDDLEF